MLLDILMYCTVLYCTALHHVEGYRCTSVRDNSFEIDRTTRAHHGIRQIAPLKVQLGKEVHIRGSGGHELELA